MKYLVVQIKEHLNLIVKIFSKKTIFFWRIPKKWPRQGYINHYPATLGILLFNYENKNEDFRRPVFTKPSPPRNSEKTKKNANLWVLDILRLHSVKAESEFQYSCIGFQIVKLNGTELHVRWNVIYQRCNYFRLLQYQKISTPNMIWHNRLRMFNALPASVNYGRNFDEIKCQIFEIMREQFPVWKIVMSQ
jgi:hypothetical protein